MGEFVPRRNDYLEAVSEFFKNVPFHKTMGARLDSVSPGIAEVSLKVTESLTQQLGYVHAGVLIGLADNAVGAAAATLLDKGQSLVSTNFAVSLFRPGQGESIRAVGEVIKTGKRFLFCEARLYRDDGELITAVSITLAIVSDGSK